MTENVKTILLQMEAHLIGYNKLQAELDVIGGKVTPEEDVILTNDSEIGVIVDRINILTDEMF